MLENTIIIILFAFAVYFIINKLRKEWIHSNGCGTGNGCTKCKVVQKIEINNFKN